MFETTTYLGVNTHRAGKKFFIPYIPSTNLVNTNETSFFQLEQTVLTNEMIIRNGGRTSEKTFDRNQPKMISLRYFFYLLEFLPPFLLTFCWRILLHQEVFP